MRFLSLLILIFAMLSCTSSSVYEMSEEQQEGLTFKLYEEQPADVFRTVNQVLENYESDLLEDEGWQIVSSNEEEGNLETNWRAKSNTGSGDAGVIGSGTEERFKINVDITERDSGSLVYLQLERQMKMTGDPETEGQWQLIDVNRQAAKNHLQPIFEELENRGLTPQD